MRDTIFNKRIPTLLGITIIIIGVVATTFLSGQGITYKSNATLSQTPTNVRITDANDSSFTVSYVTNDKTIGSLQHGTTENLGSTAIEETLQAGDTSGTHTHRIQVTNLTASTTYFFSIISSGTTYLDKGKPFQTKTGQKFSVQPSQILKGTLLFPQNVTAEALVYIAAPGSQTLSTRVLPDGSYTIDIAQLRKIDLSSYTVRTPDTTLNMLLTNHLQTSAVSLFAHQGEIPTVILSQNYDFTVQEQPVFTPFETSSFSSLSASESAGTNPQIISPQKNDAFTDQQPSFKGTGKPNTEVEITIHSEELIQTTVKTNAQGSWSFRPSTKLVPGQHTITISTRDAFGILKTITQSFTVYAEGTQVNQSATPSATLAPIIPSATVTPTPTVSSLPTTTPILLSTSTLTPTPTVFIPAATPTIIVSQKEITSPGNASVLVISSIGAAITFFGSLLFMLQRKML